MVGLNAGNSNSAACLFIVQRMAWQWAEALEEIRESDIRGTTKKGAYTIFSNINLTGLYV